MAVILVIMGLLFAAPTMWVSGGHLSLYQRAYQRDVFNARKFQRTAVLTLAAPTDMSTSAR